MQRKFAFALGIAVFGLISSVPLKASSITTVNLGNLSGTVSNSGTLPNEAQVIEEPFTLTAPSAFTAFTTSYALGGFEPMLTLYNSAGDYVAGESVTSPVATTDTTTGLAADAFLTDPHLPAGGYILVLTDFLNQQSATATNLSDGFTGSGGSTFIDEMGNSRSAAFAVTISATPLTPVSTTPEPGSIWLVLIPLVGVLVVKKSRSLSV